MLNRLRKLTLRAAATVVVPSFHLVYYNSRESWVKNTFLGFPIWQNPFDLQLYQELIVRLRPAFIVQTGIAQGGSLLYYATILDAIKAPPSALVIGVDIEHTDSAKRLDHPRIRKIIRSSTAPETIVEIDGLLGAERHGLVVLDSDHSEKHVAAELELYRRYVAPNGYLVVEDCNVNGHPVFRSHGPGPLEATNRFLVTHPEFVRDDALWQRNLFSYHQRGWLKRVA